MKEKSAESVTSNASEPGQKIKEEVAFGKVSSSSIDDVLVNDMLVSIFECLPASDRMRLELVSKKWNRLANKWSWCNYTVVSYKQFPGCDKWENAHTKFKSLFLRCGRFVKELDFFNQISSIQITGDNVCCLLQLLPNLRHLNLHGISLSGPAFKQISEALPFLISFGFVCSTSDNFCGITSVLEKCKELEILQMHGSKIPNKDAYQFVVLPPALKYVYLGPFVDCRSFFEQLKKQGIQLESLEFDVFTLTSSNLFILSSISFDRLRYLALQMYHGLLHDFVQLAKKFSHLQALELDIFDATLDDWTDELFEVIANKCPNLEHFGLRVFHFNPISGEKLALLAGLPKLCSVHVHSHRNAHPIPIFTLIEKLCQNGQLQYFHTNRALFLENVCDALIHCGKLAGIFCGRTGIEERQEDFNRLLNALDIIHEGEQPPASANDDRIFHTNFGSFSKENLPQHPWARFYAVDEQVPSNKIGERICFGGVSSKPRSAQFW